MLKSFQSPIFLGLCCALPVCVQAQAAAKPQSCLSQNELNSILKNAVNSVDFENVIDLGPTFTESTCPPSEPVCKHGRAAIGRALFPQIDLAVIAFQPECKNNIVGSNVFFSRDFPRGISATFAPGTQSVSNIKLYKWTQERFDEARVVSKAPWLEPVNGAWRADFLKEDLINSASPLAHTQFMSPYPASVFKILVALRVLQKLEEQGPLSEQLEKKFTYNFGTLETSDDVTLSFRQFLDAMIQWSGNKATAAMIQYLHQTGDIVESDIKDSAGYPAAQPKVNNLNKLFAEMGLPTLQMNRTRSKDGLWGNRDTMYLKESSSVSHISMPSWDTARLLWLMRTMESTPERERPQWLVSRGQNKKVEPGLVSDNVKKYFWANLKDQLFHEVLSNGTHCKQASGGAFGIPAAIPMKWVSGNQLKLPVGEYPFVFAADELSGDYNFSKDISECQKNAEVQFASKTGLTSVSGSHAGLVKGLSERGFNREYIVVLNSSLGSRFTDSDRLDSERVIPCFDKTLCYTSRINQLGANLDASLKKWLERNENNTSSAAHRNGQAKSN